MGDLFEEGDSVWPRRFGGSKKSRGPARILNARACESFASVTSILPRRSMPGPGLKPTTCGLGIRESGSPYLLIRWDSFLVIRPRSGLFRRAVCSGICNPSSERHGESFRTCPVEPRVAAFKSRRSPQTSDGWSQSLHKPGAHGCTRRKSPPLHISPVYKLGINGR
jgi:hypothetical protein